MFEVIDLKNTVGIVANLCNLQSFANKFVCTVLTDLMFGAMRFIYQINRLTTTKVDSTYLG